MKTRRPTLFHRVRLEHIVIWRGRIEHYFVRSSQDEMLSSANLPTYVPDTWAPRNFPLPTMVSSFSAGMELGRGSAHPFTGSSTSNCVGVLLFQKSPALPPFTFA